MFKHKLAKTTTVKLGKHMQDLQIQEMEKSPGCIYVFRKIIRANCLL